MLANVSSKAATGWILAIIAGSFLALYSAYPQIKLIYNESGQWNGHYAYNDIDEVAYAAYLKALMDGRPRKNDPYTGRDDRPGDPQPESLFSIQFAAPYAVAIPARLTGISAPTAMTLTGIVSAFVSALLFALLLWKITGNPWFGMAGSLIVLCGGALAAGEGAVGEILGTGFAYPYFPAFRRYLPAVPFAAFTGLVLVVWEWMNAEGRRRRVLLAVLISALFAFTVFSYFYIWTSAAAWLAILGLLTVLLKRQNRLSDLFGFAAVAVACLVPLGFYAALLAQRAVTVDKVQLLVFTHAADLQRFPVYVGLLAVAILVAGAVLKRIDLRGLSSIFALSLAIAPLILFNQQVLTGRSLQPIHYQVFIGNYIAALGLVTAGGLFVKNWLLKGSASAKAVCAALAAVAVLWGFVECHYTVRVLDRANLLRDGQMPAERLLREDSQSVSDPHRTTIFAATNIFADDSPTIAPQAVLWSRHQQVFAGLTWDESKERYYRQMYYLARDADWLDRRLKAGDFVSMIALFGWGRHSDRLSSQAKPLTYGEIDAEAGRFRVFTEEFSAVQAYDPLLTHAVIPVDWDVDLSNLDRWYERDEGTRAGNQIVYRLKPRFYQK